jgi:hypothetical protein
VRHVYRVEYAPPGKRAIVRTYESEVPLARGQWIDVGGIFLIVERVVPAKHGDAYDGIALCKPAMG